MFTDNRFSRTTCWPGSSCSSYIWSCSGRLDDPLVPRQGRPLLTPITGITWKKLNSRMKANSTTSQPTNATPATIEVEAARVIVAPSTPGDHREREADDRRQGHPTEHGAVEREAGVQFGADRQASADEADGATEGAHRDDECEDLDASAPAARAAGLRELDDNVHDAVFLAITVGLAGSLLSRATGLVVRFMIPFK